MKVREVMETNVEFVDEERNMVEAAQLMVKKNIGCLIVVKGHEIKGIITERDILKNAKGICGEILIKNIMTKKVVTINADALIEDAAELMRENKIKKLPVIEKGNVVGIITATDLIAYQDKLVEKLAEILPFERKELIGT